MNIPIISLEIKGMRCSIQKALSQHLLETDAMVQKAIETYCSSDNIERIIQETTFRTIDAVVREEVEIYFRNGEGRKEISNAVKEVLSKRQE